MARQNAAVELVDDARDVGLRLVVGGNSVVPGDSLGASIVGGQRESQVVAILGEQSVKIG